MKRGIEPQTRSLEEEQASRRRLQSALRRVQKREQEVSDAAVCLAACMRRKIRMNYADKLQEARQRAAALCQEEEDPRVRAASYLKTTIGPSLMPRPSWDIRSARESVAEHMGAARSQSEMGMQRSKSKHKRRLGLNSMLSHPQSRTDSQMKGRYIHPVSQSEREHLDVSDEHLERARDSRLEARLSAHLRARNDSQLKSRIGFDEMKPQHLQHPGHTDAHITLMPAWATKIWSAAVEAASGQNGSGVRSQSELGTASNRAQGLLSSVQRDKLSLSYTQPNKRERQNARAIVEKVLSPHDFRLALRQQIASSLY